MLTNLARRAWLLLAAPLALTLLGCGLFSDSAKDKASDKAPKGVGDGLDSSTPFLVEHGKLIGVVIGFLLVAAFLKWIWGNTGLRIVGAMIGMGLLVWYVMSR